jgi:hypothetical protein
MARTPAQIPRGLSRKSRSCRLIEGAAAMLERVLVPPGIGGWRPLGRRGRQVIFVQRQEVVRRGDPGPPRASPRAMSSWPMSRARKPASMERRVLARREVDRVQQGRRNRGLVRHARERHRNPANPSDRALGNWPDWGPRPPADRERAGRTAVPPGLGPRETRDRRAVGRAAKARRRPEPRTVPIVDQQGGGVRAARQRGRWTARRRARRRRARARRARSSRPPDRRARRAAQLGLPAAAPRPMAHPLAA